MADIITIFGVISIIVFFGFFAEIIFKKTQIPDVLLLIFVGILMGSVFNWVSPRSFGQSANLFATFTLVFLLFQGALSINFVELFQSLKSVMKLTVLSFVLTTVVSAVISIIFLKLSILSGLLVGTILGGTSSAVVIPILNQLAINKKYSIVLTLESAISDVLCIVGSITILTVIRTGIVSGQSIFRTVLISFALALIVGGIAGILWAYLISGSETLMNSYMLTIAVVMGVYAFVESPFVQASGAIAALAFGLVLGNSKSILTQIRSTSDKDVTAKSVLPFSAKNFYKEISFLVKVFFFVYLGILFDFSQPIFFLYGLFITLGIFAIRPLAVKYSFLKEGIDVKTRTILQVLIPKGLAAAVLAQMAIQYGLPQAQSIVSTVLAVILISIIFTSFFIYLASRNIFLNIPFSRG